MDAQNLTCLKWNVSGSRPSLGCVRSLVSAKTSTTFLYRIGTARFSTRMNRIRTMHRNARSCRMGPSAQANVTSRQGQMKMMMSLSINMQSCAQLMKQLLQARACEQAIWCHLARHRQWRFLAGCTSFSSSSWSCPLELQDLCQKPEGLPEGHPLHLAAKACTGTQQVLCQSKHDAFTKATVKCVSTAGAKLMSRQGKPSQMCKCYAGADGSPLQCELTT